MLAYGLACLVGVVTGLRAMTGAAAAGWAAYLGVLPVGATWLAWLGSPWTVGILTVVAGAELVTDQLASTPSRKVPLQFGTRLVVGAVAGGAFGLAGGSVWLGGLAGIVGAVIGTLGGAGARARLAASFGRDLPAALAEDVVAIVLALGVVMVLR